MTVCLLSPRKRQGVYGHIEDGVCRLEDGDFIIEVKSFFDDDKTGELMCEGYILYNSRQLEGHVPFFDKKVHAKKGFKADVELLCERYPRIIPADSIIGKAHVKDNTETLAEARGCRKYKSYFYRYEIDNVNQRMLPCKVLI